MGVGEKQSKPVHNIIEEPPIADVNVYNENASRPIKTNILYLHLMRNNNNNNKHIVVLYVRREEGLNVQFNSP
jgi:hypothetical protein